MPFKIHRKSRRAECSGRGETSEGRHTVRSNEICYSGPFYTHLITRSNRFCETPSPFEDTPTTHVIWLVFYMRYQPRPIMRADHNVPVIRWAGDSVRWNHNLGQLKTDPWLTGSHNAPKKEVAQLVHTQERFSITGLCKMISRQILYGSFLIFCSPLQLYL